MTRRFQERFSESGSDSFDFDGQTVHAIYRRPIEPGDLVEVEFLGCRRAPPQGLQLAVKGALLAWDEHGAEGRSIRLWADEQSRATIRYVNPSKTTEISIWSIWLDERTGTQSYEAARSELVQAWWAWSGMLIEASDDEVLLRCSGNYGGPNFDDLRVRLRFRSQR